jgi:hypothetical protein
MSLIEQLKTTVLDPLAPYGWREMFSHHGLDITVPLDKLGQELSKPLLVDRSAPGFEEFSLAGIRGVEPGQLGLSLLYHALASPTCAPLISGSTPVFPTLFQLDVVENYIYGCYQRAVSDFKDPVLAVFAYQYRDRRRTTHRQHADVMFSRTGVARVGNHAAEYDGPSRGYLVNPGGGARGFRVLPARYGLFIAERKVRGADGTVLRPIALDSELTFLFPVHKIFSGDECIFQRVDDTLVPIRVGALDYVEVHINEKLARVHDEQGGENDAYVPPHPDIAFDRRVYPFVRTSRADPTLVTLSSLGASCLVVPVHRPLVATATQMVDGRNELVRFKVPAPRTVRGRPNRYWSTLELTARGNSRAAPEYLNIRQEPRSTDTVELVDLNNLDSAEFKSKVLDTGGYEAAHFVDNTCDGALTVRPVDGINLPIHCAFSLVTAIDYFPLVDQVEVEEWIEGQQRVPTGLANVGLYFPQGGPQPMSDGRFSWDTDGDIQGTSLTYQLPNCNLPHPVVPGRSAFGLEDPSNFTATALVGPRGIAPSMGTLSDPRRTLSWLPDAASDVHAPGWEVSQHQRENRNMLVSYGLGSPFPEDAKLCAALNSFWPAVAPDSSRTYGFRPPRPGTPPRRLLFTSLPLTDSELGRHPRHPRVLAKEVASDPGWDGDYGPYLSSDKGSPYVYASNPLRADQTRAALEGRLHFAGLDCITTDEFISRIHALSWCRQQCDEWCRQKFGRVLNHLQSGWWLLSFENVPLWDSWRSAIYPKADSILRGPGYIVVFVTVGDPEEFESPPLRVRYPLRDRLEIQLSDVEYFRPYATKTAPPPIAFLRKNEEAPEKLKL